MFLREIKKNTACLFLAESKNMLLFFFTRTVSQDRQKIDSKIVIIFPLVKTCIFGAQKELSQ